VLAKLSQKMRSILSDPAARDQFKKIISGEATDSKLTAAGEEYHVKIGPQRAVKEAVKRPPAK